MSNLYRPLASFVIAVALLQGGCSKTKPVSAAKVESTAISQAAPADLQKQPSEENISVGGEDTTAQTLKRQGPQRKTRQNGTVATSSKTLWPGKMNLGTSEATIEALKAWLDYWNAVQQDVKKFQDAAFKRMPHDVEAEKHWFVANILFYQVTLVAAETQQALYMERLASLVTDRDKQAKTAMMMSRLYSNDTILSSRGDEFRIQLARFVGFYKEVAPATADAVTVCFVEALGPYSNEVLSVRRAYWNAESKKNPMPNAGR